MFIMMPILHTDQGNLRRMEHTRLRRRMLYDEHIEDIKARLRQSISDVRADAWGPIDMSSNPFQHVWTELSALYDESPTITAPGGAEPVTGLLDAVGYWSLMQRIQRDTLGMRECLVRFDIVNTGLAVRVVYPDQVTAKAPPGRPDDVYRVTEWQEDEENPGEWIRIVTDSSTATHYAVDSHDRDVSERVLGGKFSGEAYPWRDSVGVPYLPYVVYHAAHTGWMWDPYHGRGVVEATLQLGVLYSYYHHIVRNASWGQRYAVNATIPGAEVDGPEGAPRSHVTADPSTVLLLHAVDESAPVAVGQWVNPADPDRVLTSIIRYERRVVEMATGAADVTRQTADVRSGYSLAVSRESKILAQRKYAPIFRRSDLQVLALVGRMIGIEPTEPWQIDYQIQALDTEDTPNGDRRPNPGTDPEG